MIELVDLSKDASSEFEITFLLNGRTSKEVVYRSDLIDELQRLTTAHAEILKLKGEDSFER